MTATLSVPESTRDRLKGFGTAGMTYDEILQRMMDRIEQEEFVRDCRRTIAETKDEDWIDLDDIE